MPNIDWSKIENPYTRRVDELNNELQILLTTKVATDPVKILERVIITQMQMEIVFNEAIKQAKKLVEESNK
ncbi:hypothetical protein KKB3_01055 [Dehalococcoides mccartyi]|nr:hypothetical protein KKB3_01055 [Dehalococcoides mccartyi]